MKLKKAIITMLDLDLKGCLYLNHFSHSQTVAYFFKIIIFVSINHIVQYLNQK